MDLNARIIAARDTAGRAVNQARELAAQMNTKQAAGESFGDIEASFNKATADATASMAELTRLSNEAAIEQHAAELSRPQVTPVVRGIERHASLTPSEMRLAKKLDRQSRQNLKMNAEAFARAGVTDLDKFKSFRDAHADSFVPFVTEGPLAAMKVIESHGFKPAEGFALLSTQGDLGGFLVPDDFRAEVLKDLAGFAVIRPNARVLATGRSALTFPSIQAASTDADIYATGYAGAWRGEGYVTGGTAPTVQNQPKFGQTRIPVHVWAPNAVEVTQELMQDSAADLDAILSEVIAETLALDEDSAFFNGTGVNQPLGLLNTVSGTEITAVNAGHASLLTYEGLVDLFSNLPSQYRQNGKWIMSSLTFGAILKLKDGQGMPVFPVNAIPGQLWGKPIVFSEFMPEIAANAMVALFGDLNYYGIADRQELRVQRLVERYAPNVGILPTARLGGQPLRAAAFRKLKIAA